MHEHDVGALDGDVGACADRDAHVGACEGRRIVDAVADHGYATALRKHAHHLLLAVGLHARYHAADAHLALNCRGCALVIACEHHGVDAHLVQCFHSGSTRWLNDISHGYHTDKHATLREIQHRLTVI